MRKSDKLRLDEKPEPGEETERRKPGNALVFIRENKQYKLNGKHAQTVNTESLYCWSDIEDVALILGS